MFYIDYKIKIFSNIFRSIGFGQVMFEYSLYPIYVLLMLTNFIYKRVSLLLSSLNDASVDIVDDEFSRKTGFKPPLCVHISIDTEAESLQTLTAVLEICWNS